MQNGSPIEQEERKENHDKSHRFQERHYQITEVVFCMRCQLLTGAGAGVGWAPKCTKGTYGGHRIQDAGCLRARQGSTFGLSRCPPRQKSVSRTPPKPNFSHTEHRAVKRLGGLRAASPHRVNDALCHLQGAPGRRANLES